MRIDARMLLVALWVILPGLTHVAIAQNLQAGFSAGINRTALDYDETLPFWTLKQRTLFHLAGFIVLPVGKRLDFQTGIRFVKIGNEVDLAESPDPFVVILEEKFQLTQDFLALPATIRYSLPGRPRLYLLSGMEAAYSLSASADITYRDGSTAQQDIQKTLNRLNLSALLGTGVAVDLAGVSLFAESRYAYGLTDIPKKDQWISAWQTRELSFNLGVKICFLHCN